MKKILLFLLSTLFIIACGPLHDIDDAYEALKNEDYKLAVSYCDEIIEYEPDNNMAYYIRGFSYYYLYREEDDFETSHSYSDMCLSDCSTAIKLTDSSEESKIQLGNFYLGMIKYYLNSDDYETYLLAAGEDGEKCLKELKESEEQKKFYEDDHAFDKYSSQGSGFIIDPSGFIATNNHVIEGEKDIEVWFDWSGSRKSYKAEPVVTDPKNDIAILRITDENFTMDPIPYVIAEKQSQTGVSVFTLGYPDIFDLGGEIKMTKGVISSLSGYKGDKRKYQIDANIHGGNSGGPLFDESGMLIGINSSSFTEDANIHYSVKSTLLLNLLKKNKLNMDLNYENTLDSLSLAEKVQIISPYVVLITNK